MTKTPKKNSLQGIQGIPRNGINHLEFARCQNTRLGLRQRAAFGDQVVHPALIPNTLLVAYRALLELYGKTRKGSCFSGSAAGSPYFPTQHYPNVKLPSVWVKQ